MVAVAGFLTCGTAQNVAPIFQLDLFINSIHAQSRNMYVSCPQEETGSLQVANTSKYATKSLHETQNPALADWDFPTHP